MKRGDLVKHPKGIENVCKEKLGIILSEYTPQHPTGAQQVTVMWRGMQSYLVYNADQLEVISENR
jgi:phage host-nuclease inhibitor protein Gam